MLYGLELVDIPRRAEHILERAHMSMAKITQGLPRTDNYWHTDIIISTRYLIFKFRYHCKYLLWSNISEKHTPNYGIIHIFCNIWMIAISFTFLIFLAKFGPTFAKNSLNLLLTIVVTFDNINRSLIINFLQNLGKLRKYRHRPKVREFTSISCFK